MEEKKKISAYQKLVEGLESIIESGKYKEFLKSMKKFHHYSFSNRLLIFAQNPEATRVAGYCTWKKLGRGVKSNPKKIFILKPIPYKIEKNEKEENNSENKETLELIKYGWTIVYDISDTYIREDGKEIPLIDDIKLNSASSEKLYDVLLKVSPVKVCVETTFNGSDGYYSKSLEKIVISNTLSLDDATTTLLHEISHALYDDFDYSKDRNLSEIFVESIAFIVADYFGLDASKCSFSYITKWCKGDTKKLLELGNKIQENSNKFIEKINDELNKQDKIAA